MSLFLPPRVMFFHWALCIIIVDCEDLIVEFANVCLHPPPRTYYVNSLFLELVFVTI